MTKSRLIFCDTTLQWMKEVSLLFSSSPFITENSHLLSRKGLWSFVLEIAYMSGESWNILKAILVTFGVDAQNEIQFSLVDKRNHKAETACIPINETPAWLS